MASSRKKSVASRWLLIAIGLLCASMSLASSAEKENTNNEGSGATRELFGSSDVLDGPIWIGEVAGAVRGLGGPDQHETSSAPGAPPRLPVQGAIQLSRQSSPLLDRLGLQLSVDSDRLVIDDVAASGMFGKAGLQQGDIIVAVRGRSIRTADEFNKQLFSSAPGENVEVTALRNGHEQTFRVRPTDYLRKQPTTNRAVLGVNLDRRYIDRVVLSSVTPGGPADLVGLQRGDVILAVEGHPVSSTTELIAQIAKHSPGDKIEIKASRGEQVDVATVVLSAVTRATGPQLPPEAPVTGHMQGDSGAEPESTPNPFAAERLQQETRAPQPRVLPPAASARRLYPQLIHPQPSR